MACRARYYLKGCLPVETPQGIHRVRNMNLAFDKFRHRAGHPPTILVCLTLGLLVAAGCGVFNPAFLSSVDPAGIGGFTTQQTPPGFVVITFANNARVDELLLSHLESAAGGGLELTDQEKQELRPRVKVPVRITFVGGGVLDVEFVSGSTKLVDPRFSAQSAPDLNVGSITNIVAVCDVESVTLVPGEPIEVFIPAQLTQLELVQTSADGGDIVTTFEPRALITPRFRTLEVDELDANGITIFRNIGIQDLPGPTINPLCGSVIGIVLDGELTVPFHPAGDGPSFDQDDDITIGTIGGRYEFRVTIG